MALRKEQLSLKKWSNQEWRTSDGSESKGKKRYLPDSAWDALSPGEKAATNRAKKAGDEKGKQFVAQPKKIAKKTARYRKMNEELELRIRHLAKKDPEIHEIDADNQDLFTFRKYERAEEVIPALVEEAGAAAGGASAAPSAPSTGGDASAPSDSGSAPSQPSEGGSDQGGESEQDGESKDQPKARTGSRYYHIPGYRAGFVSPYPFLRFSKKKKKKDEEEEETLKEEYYVLNEAKASDIKGTGRVANMAREYLSKYPTKFTFRANKHVETLEKYLGPKAKDVVRVIIGGYFIPTYEGPTWTGTAAIAFTNDKIFVAQKGLLFGTENVKTINRDKIDDVQISRGMIYGMFTIHARSEYLMVGVLHKNALLELQDFLEKYADSKIKVKASQEADLLSKQVVNESLAEAVANLSEDMFRATLVNQGGETVEYTVDADDADEAITKTIDAHDVDVENIRDVVRVSDDAQQGSENISEASDAEKPKKKSEVDDLMDEFGQPSSIEGAVQKAVEQGEEEDWDQPEEKEPKYHPDRIVPQEEIDREERFKKNTAAYNKQRIEGIKSGKPFIDDYGGESGNLYFRDPNSGKMFKKKLPINPATGKQYEFWEYVGTDDWNQPDPEGYRDPKTGELVLKDGKPLLNSAPVGGESYVLTEKLTRPHKGEKKQEFISRFMGDKLAKKEFKDNKQRVAVAYNQWERGGLREEAMITEKELLSLFEELNLDTEKYTTEYLAEQIGYQKLEEGVFKWVGDNIFRPIAANTLNTVGQAARGLVKAGSEAVKGVANTAVGATQQLLQPWDKKLGIAGNIGKNVGGAAGAVVGGLVGTAGKTALELGKGAVNTAVAAGKGIGDTVYKGVRNIGKETDSSDYEENEYEESYFKPVFESGSINEAKERHPLLVKYGVEGFNKPKRTPGHKSKSHLVVAKKDGKVKVVRFGAQGASGSPAKEGESKSWRNRRQNWIKRHKAQNPSGFKDKFSALYWANKVKW